MTETKKTLTLVGVAVVLVVLALLTAPKRITPTAFVDQDEAFFPDFDDPNRARTLEVMGFDEETGSAVPFKVTSSGGRWSIPSHHGYPADGKDRLAKTAAGVIDIKKDDFRSDNVADHEACGVIDPLDQSTATMTGRGKRVTIKGENDVVLADFIVGNEIEDRENFRFVRVPGQKRVYAARMDIDLSTNFKDWIESDLLQINTDDIEQVTIKDYTINERTGQVNERGVLVLTKSDNTWSANNMQPSEEVDQTKANGLLTALQNLSIEGVRPKPEGLSASLTRPDSMRVTTADLLSLQSKGYFFSRDGRLLSNEGELQARTGQGVIYTLRFGEIVYGSGLAVTAGGSGDETADDGRGENRYLFITTEFDPSYFPEPAKPANTNYLSKPDSLWTDDDRRNRELNQAHERWQSEVSERRRISDELNARFAKWYYVISAKSFDELHLTRADLLREKEES